MEQEITTISPNSPSIFKGAIEAGYVAAALIIIYTLVLFVAKLHTIQVLSFIGSLLVLGAQIHFGMKFRKNQMNNNMTFGQAFKFGLSMLLINSLVTFIFNYFYFEFIAPEVVSLAVQETYNSLINGGLSEEQANIKMGLILPRMNSFTFSVGYLFLTLVFGLLTALIAAAFVKRESISI